MRGATGTKQQGRVAAQVDFVALGDVAHHAVAIGVVGSKLAMGQSRKHIGTARAAGSIAALVRQRERGALVGQRHVGATATVGKELAHRRLEGVRRSVDGAVVQLQSELAGESLVDLRRQRMADGMAKDCELSCTHASSW